MLNIEDLWSVAGFIMVNWYLLRSLLTVRSCYFSHCITGCWALWTSATSGPENCWLFYDVVWPSSFQTATISCGQKTLGRKIQSNECVANKCMQQCFIHYFSNSLHSSKVALLTNSKPTRKCQTICTDSVFVTERYMSSLIRYLSKHPSLQSPGFEGHEGQKIRFCLQPPLAW